MTALLTNQELGIPEDATPAQRAARAGSGL
jgi:hypothetical protein